MTKVVVKPFAFSSLLLAGCSTVGYDTVKPGSYTGAAVVVWVGAGNDAVLGDGQFLYVPVKNQELTFTRPQDGNPSSDPLTIRPEAFYTDGGSIPRSVQAFRGLNAWAYGPAYVIHDWAFVARKCLNDADENGQVIDDGKDLITDEMRKIKSMTFRESAVLMAETIRTLAADYDIDPGLSGPLISNVTAGPISYRLWTQTGKCRELRVSNPEHLEIIADLQDRDADALTATLGDTLRNANITSTGGHEYRVVATFNLNRANGQ